MTGTPPVTPLHRAAPPDRAIRSPLAAVLFLVVALGGLAADLASKHCVFRSMLDDPQLPQKIKPWLQANSIQQASPQDRTRMLLRSSNMADFFQRPFLPGIKFTLSTNPGIVFGSTAMPRWAVNVATVLTVLLVGFFFTTSHRRAWPMHIALGCIVGGALGNLYDRLFSVVSLPGQGLEAIKGEVRDFIDCSGLHYPWVFNVADMLLVLGVAIIVLYWLIAGAKARKAEPAAE